jgi:glutaminyl-tRNA synthetase
MDDTNPAKEDVEFVDSIKEDVSWLGFKWDGMFYASDYYQKIYEYAIDLIKMEKAYVCDLTAEQMRTHRGTLSEPGKESPFRNRSVSENLSLFEGMKNGLYADGEKTLRAKIDMRSPNINLRDPVLYRIRKVAHHRTGNDWCMYPIYDYAHALSDMLEGITHSICTLEFEDHRPLYDWFLATLNTAHRPQQIEFSRLNLDYTVMSKRKLLELVTEKFVEGWDDPRMPTIQGFRRRGYTPASIRDFCDRIGVTKKDNCIELSTLEACIREDLDKNASRVMAVLRPLKIEIENVAADAVVQCPVANHPQRPELGTREVPFTKTIFIEQDDFMEAPPKGFHRLVPGGEVRLRGAYLLKCNAIEKDASGKPVLLRCTIDPETLGKNAADGRKVKGTIHWVSATHSDVAEIRLYDRLFETPLPDAEDWRKQIYSKSLERITDARVESWLKTAPAETRFQFERLGYFCTDRHDHKTGTKAVLNRTVTLRDSWTAK